MLQQPFLSKVKKKSINIYHLLCMEGKKLIQTIIGNLEKISKTAIKD